MTSDTDLYFRYRCLKGYKQRKLDFNNSTYKDRLEYEMEVIVRTGFASYFLVVSDLLEWARKNNIPTGPGRGSAAGALVSYCLYITHIDPVKYDLDFARFMNESRISSGAGLPDIDMDFCKKRRHEVVDYVSKKYGQENVANIGTYGSMKARGAIRDVTRVLGYKYGIGDKLAKLCLPPIEGKDQSLETCYEQVPELKAFRDNEGSPEAEVLYWAGRLENRKRSFGTHAAGVVLSDEPVSNTLPLYPGKDKQPTSQFEMYTVEDVGLIKFDFLGLKSLTTIQTTVDLIKQNYGVEINPLELEPDDQKTFELLQTGDVMGVFQFEGSSGIRDLLIQYKPTCLEDLAALNAVFRPGPLRSGLHEQMIGVRHGKAATYLIPQLEPILKNTGGVCLYQEQTIRALRDVGGFTSSRADIVRRIIGKKKIEEAEAAREEFVTGAKKKNISTKDANEVFDMIKNMSSYQFNKSHSISYSFIGYQMAYLKAHYPIEFICACLISDANNTDKVVKWISYCRARGVKVLPPDINTSQLNFSIADESIKFGLLPIKHLGKGPVGTITRARKKKPFKSFEDFIERIDTKIVNKQKLKALVLAGAFDSLGYSRKSLSLLVDKTKDILDGQIKYEKDLKKYEEKLDKYKKRQEEIEAWAQLSKEEKKGLKKPGKLKEPKPPAEPPILKVKETKEMSDAELLQNERDLLGFYISGHPLDLLAQNIGQRCTSIEEIKELSDNNQPVELLCIPSQIKEATAKSSKKKFAYVVLEDKTGTIEAVLQSKVYASYGSLLDTSIPIRCSAKTDVVQRDDSKAVKLRVTYLHQVPIPISKEHLILEIPSASMEEIISIVAQDIGEGSVISLSLLLENGGKLQVGDIEYRGNLSKLRSKLENLCEVR